MESQVSCVPVNLTRWGNGEDGGKNPRVLPHLVLRKSRLSLNPTTHSATTDASCTWQSRPNKQPRPCPHRAQGSAPETNIKQVIAKPAPYLQLRSVLSTENTEELARSSCGRGPGHAGRSQPAEGGVGDLERRAGLGLGGSM